MKRHEKLDELDLSLGDIHRGTGLSRSMISRVFSGTRAPSTETEGKIAAYLGMRLDKFRELWTKLYQSAHSKSVSVSPSSTEPSKSPGPSRPKPRVTLQ